METDITTYAASYVLVRLAIVSVLGYGIFRVLAASQSPRVKASAKSTNAGQA